MNLNSDITILGFSEATLTMIFDILESNNHFPKINIINNLSQLPNKTFINPNFEINFFKEVQENYHSNFVIGVTQKNTKINLLNNFQQINLNQFINLISKNSDISSTVKIGVGNIINTMVCIAGQSSIGNYVFINRNVSIGHHTTIGDYTTINPGTNIAGNVTIGNSCQIGIGVNVFDGIKIGNNSIIGGGSLVTKDIPDNVLAYGNPCKIIKTI